MLITAVRFSGNVAFSADRLQELAAPFLGRPVTLVYLDRLTKIVTDEYRAEGYSLARAFVPKQEIKDGVVEIAVLEGNVGTLTIEGSHYYSEDFIRRRFASVLEDPAFKLASLERALLLLNENPDLNVTAVLEPGKAIGTTDLTAKAKDKLPLHWTGDYNNFGAPTVSRNRFGLGVEAGNVLADGGVLTLNSIMGADIDKLFFYMGSYSLPVNSYGTRLVASASNGRYDVGGELAALGIRGKITTYDLSITHPLIKTRFESLLLDVGFAAKDNRLFLAGALNGDDSLRMAKVGINYDRVDTWGRNFVSAYGFQGLGHVLGGMQDNAPLATQVNADNRFTKGVVTLGRLHNLGSGMQLILRGTGQVSTGPLPIIEKMMLGGADSVRGYLLGEQLGDQGYAVTAEMRIPVPKTDNVQLALFVDNGAAQSRKPSVGQQAYHNLTGVGPGLRIGVEEHLQMRLDVGFPIQPDRAQAGSLNGGTSPTVYAQVMGRF